MTAFAILLLVGQWVVVLLLLRFVKTFGAYTATVLRAEERTAQIHAEQVAMLEELRNLQKPREAA